MKFRYFRKCSASRGKERKMGLESMNYLEGIGFSFYREFS